MEQSEFPPGWNEKRLARVLTHYELQSEDQAVAEDEAAFKISEAQSKKDQK